jgi:hypothetical protein
MNWKRLLKSAYPAAIVIARYFLTMLLLKVGLFNKYYIQVMMFAESTL